SCSPVVLWSGGPMAMPEIPGTPASAGTTRPAATFLLLRFCQCYRFCCYTFALHKAQQSSDFHNLLPFWCYVSAFSLPRSRKTFRRECSQFLLFRRGSCPVVLWSGGPMVMPEIPGTPGFSRHQSPRCYVS